MIQKDCIVAGHRGFKAKYTENTLNGFHQCFKTGASIFETDVWTTKDHVLVISHDVNTKRIFCDENGNEADYNILETEYKDLKPLRTIASGEPLLRFVDVLNWFVKYTKEHELDSGTGDHKIMLDLKAANPPIILKLLIEDMLGVNPDLSWWFPRLQLGLWHLRFMKYLNQDPDIQQFFRNVSPYMGYSQFEILHISLGWRKSMIFLAYNEYLDSLPKDTVKLKTTGVSIIYTSTWDPSFVKYFIPSLKKQDLSLYSWTINLRSQLEYFRRLCAFARIHEYGVISDYPDKMVEFCSEEGVEPISMPPKASFYQRFLCCFLTAVMKLPLVNDGGFDDYVDPVKVTPAKETLGRKFFALLQHLGIF